MKDPGLEVQAAIMKTALEDIRDGRQRGGRPVWDLIQLREIAKQALEKVKQAEERYGTATQGH